MHQFFLPSKKTVVTLETLSSPCVRLDRWTVYLLEIVQHYKSHKSGTSTVAHTQKVVHLITQSQCQERYTISAHSDIYKVREWFDLSLLTH